MDTKKKIIIGFVAILLIACIAAIPIVLSGNSSDKDTFKTVVAEATEENVQKVEDDADITKQEVQVEKIDPSASEKLATKLHTPKETLIFFGSIIVASLVLLLIAILFAVRNRKRD